MFQRTSCPAPQELHNFALGQITEAAQARIERHLRACPSCIEHLNNISTDDLLIETMRCCAADAIDSGEKDTVDALIEELQRPITVPAWIRRKGKGKGNGQPARPFSWRLTIAIAALGIVVGAGVILSILARSF